MINFFKFFNGEIVMIWGDSYDIFSYFNRVGDRIKNLTPTEICLVLLGCVTLYAATYIPRRRS